MAALSKSFHKAYHVIAGRRLKNPIDPNIPKSAFNEKEEDENFKNEKNIIQNKNKCSLTEHSENDAIVYCRECKVLHV